MAFFPENLQYYLCDASLYNHKGNLAIFLHKLTELIVSYLFELLINTLIKIKSD